MFVKIGELIDVRESDSTDKDGVKTKTFNLVFLGKRWDVGLKRDVDSSVQIMIADEHKAQIPEFKKMIGQQTEVQIDARVSRQNKVWYLTSGKGLIV